MISEEGNHAANSGLGYPFSRTREEKQSFERGLGHVANAGNAFERAISVIIPTTDNFLHGRP